MAEMRVRSISQQAIAAIENAGGSVLQDGNDILVTFPEGTRHEKEQYFAEQVCPQVAKMMPEYAKAHPSILAAVHRIMLPDGTILSYSENHVPEDYDFSQPNARPVPCLVVQETVEARETWERHGRRTWKDIWFPQSQASSKVTRNFISVEDVIREKCC